MSRYSLIVTGDHLDQALEALSAAEGVHNARTSGESVVVSVDAPSMEEAIAFTRGSLPGGSYDVGRPAPLEDDHDDRPGTL